MQHTISVDGAWAHEYFFRLLLHAIVFAMKFAPMTKLLWWLGLRLSLWESVRASLRSALPSAEPIFRSKSDLRMLHHIHIWNLNNTIIQHAPFDAGTSPLKPNSIITALRMTKSKTPLQTLYVYRNVYRNEFAEVCTNAGRFGEL